MKRPKKEDYTLDQYGEFIYDLNSHIDDLEGQNKKLKEFIEDDSEFMLIELGKAAVTEAYVKYKKIIK